MLDVVTPKLFPDDNVITLLPVPVTLDAPTLKFNASFSLPAFDTLNNSPCVIGKSGAYVLELNVALVDASALGAVIVTPSVGVGVVTENVAVPELLANALALNPSNPSSGTTAKNDFLLNFLIIDSTFIMIF